MGNVQAYYAPGLNMPKGTKFSHWHSQDIFGNTGVWPKYLFMRGLRR